jgi:hypothetical protein
MTTLTKAAIGALAGTAGAFLMGEVGKVTSQMVGVRPPKGSDATEKVANAVAEGLGGHRVRYSTRKLGAQVVHYGFGAAIGVLYALVADRVPAATRGRGALLGAAVYTGVHALAVPALGLASRPLRNGARWESTELSAHLAYGTATEAIRHLLTD